ncbi:Crp/Fnr family transcriptional regulator [Brevibacillus invocatus]|uniref:Crp/Fnr family transcriptional regulator n=1 Tax=Brevibacillus invocatus TaxID=173959 RepID=UPI00203EAD83|nr:cyclic nucleotide-binding domain-containing protein [Brevibacillus invocatus]MCM3081740.1 cyclic nucleotide-binding domain-containing protein [Brevibacillus invocatus]MCM3432148.1 cyclic nucleotide-binding domain-containing protein [Brevibacillus invocatus]
MSFPNYQNVSFNNGKSTGGREEIQDRQQLNHYLQAHQIESIFNEQIFPHLSVYQFEQGEIICSQGEPAQYLYVLVEGKVKIYTTSSEGKTLILSFKTPLEVIGDIEYVRSMDILNYAITKKFTMKSNSLSFNLLHSVEVRLASYLLSVSFDESESLLPGQQSIVSLKDAANLIGTSHRHLNRVIQHFCAKGLIERNNGFISVTNRQGLRVLAGHIIYE